MKNYTKLSSKYIEEIQSNVTVYQHDKTNARICTIENNDSNKVFSIAFRTPPINSTGLTHILEHSVLCGSKNYPVKDPFVELLKSSLNTFLNAFTFPDKTMYPCASKNDNDFKNLMSVYMDAVFYPRIYEYEEIFMQEGWHYHIENESDPITYNGVVYNEMKGAFSDPQQVLFRTLMHSLYPDTPYGFESGGDPKYIPDLSYEQFKDFHSKFYHPTNSYIFVYGDCDMEERLNWLDEAYLSKFDKIEFNTEIPYQKPFDRPKYVTEYYPIAKEDSKENKTFLSYNVAFPTTLDTKLMLATALLVSALFNTPGAPIKQALIDAKIGQDVDVMFDDGLLQPLLSIMVINSNPEKEEELINLVNNEIKKTIENGINKDLLKSLLNFAEFKARERAFSPYMPQGLEVEMTCLNSWLYSEDQPYNKLEVLNYYKELKELLETDYYESILEKYILNNNHKSFVKLVPDDTILEKNQIELAKKLEDYKNSLSEDELKALITKNVELKKYQSEVSTPEELQTLPKLKLEDINENPEEYQLEVLKGDYDTLLSDYPTNDIAYVKYYFDISHISKEELLSINLFTELFTHLSTDKNTYQEINQFIQNNTGGMGCRVQSLKTIDKEAKLYLVFDFSALTENVKASNNLLVEIISATNFKDEKRLYERLCELKATLEMSVVNRGHQVALTRALSYIDESNMNKDAILGISFIDFISKITNNFDSVKADLISKLEAIKDKYISKENLVLGFTGSREQLTSLKPVFDDLYNSLNDHKKFENTKFEKNILNEGIKGQFDVNFVARVGETNCKYHGGLMALQNALSMDYLWMQVRVHGGAYGCMMFIDPSGLVGFTSYRDPNIERTNEVYEGVVDFISNMNPSDEDLLKFKIGAIGSSDAVMHIKDKAESARSCYLRGLSYDARKKNRKDLLSVTQEELRSFAGMFKDALEQNVICVIGNEDKVLNAKDLFKNIRNITK